MRRVVRDQQLKGRLGIYGMGDVGATLALLNHLQDSLIDTEWWASLKGFALSLLRETKDNEEIAQLREAGTHHCHRRRSTGIYPTPPGA